MDIEQKLDKLDFLLRKMANNNCLRSFQMLCAKYTAARALQTCIYEYVLYQGASYCAFALHNISD